MSQQIIYRFFTAESEKIVVTLDFDAKTYRLILPDRDRPDWTRLGFQRCPNCPLPETVERCPAAAALSTFLPAFTDKLSYDKAVVEVETPNRIIVSKTTFQSSMASLIGLVCACSGCPRTRFLRPMARFHLPFSDDRETVFRSFATHLLGLFVAARMAGRVPDLSLDGFREAYAQLSAVNAALAERLRAAVKRDAALNAVIILDSFAQITPSNLDGEFEDILHCFSVEAD